MLGTNSIWACLGLFPPEPDAGSFAWPADELDAGLLENPLQFDKRLGAAPRNIIGALQPFDGLPGKPRFFASFTGTPVQKCSGSLNLTSGYHNYTTILSQIDNK